MRRTLIAIVGCAAMLLVPTATALAQDPILFVHGWSRDASDWDTMIERFESDGWDPGELHAFSYDTSDSNVDTADVVADEVSGLQTRTGAAQVDVVTHSMGGLSSRYYLKNLSGTSEVDDWVSLGGPNHGTNTAFFCFDVSCFEMRPGSDFLDDLNAGDETPGPVDYGTWWSPCDEVIDPDESVILQGATNTETACIAHLELLESVTVYNQVRGFVE